LTEGQLEHFGKGRYGELNTVSYSPEKHNPVHPPSQLKTTDGPSLFLNRHKLKCSKYQKNTQKTSNPARALASTKLFEPSTVPG